MNGDVPGGPTAPGARRKRIAVVEDNPETRILARLLLKRSYEVDDYETGDLALAGFALQRPDLVLLDISLPGMDGVEVMMRIRADPSLRAIPVVAFTAYASEQERKRYLSLGFDGHVSKPIVDKSILLGTIERLLLKQESQGG
ncbi:MAG TPA: response regulator [Thermoanaerobaculia bacterium]|nr:response regulator [Thermoanaerobaculia bacterium]